MAISSGLRNRLLGFAIVVSAIIILLPLVLSKDVLQREDPQAIAINSQGVKYDEQGNLQYQSSPDIEQVLNIQSSTQLEFGQGQNSMANALPSTNNEQSETTLAAANSDNSVEMLEFSSGVVESTPASAPGRVEETLVMNTPKAPAQSTQPKEEILVAQNSAPAASAKPAQPPKPPISSAKPQAADGDKVVAGSKPKANYAIQVGVFSKKSNADNVVKKISNAGIKVYAVEINSGGRILYRVYAGAANNRNDLNETLKKVDKLCNTKGKIVSI